MRGYHRRARGFEPRLIGAILLVGALLAIGLPMGTLSLTSPSAHAVPRGFLLRSSGTGPCAGPAVSSGYLGRVADAGGGASAPPLANQSVVLSYRYTQTFHPSGGGASQYLCVSTLADGLTGPTGSFSITASVSGPFCSKPYGCWNYSGPYGPASLSLGSGALPAGFFENETTSNGTFTLTRVIALENASISPNGFLTVSVNAPTVVSAKGLSGLGTPSPANLSFAWSLTGVGWRSLAGNGAPTFPVEAVSTSNVATVEVWVNGSYGGLTFHAPPVSLLLTAASTLITSGSASPTSVDTGVDATFSWTGTGADGYPYWATLGPGLGAAQVRAACLNHSIAGGLRQFDCSVIYAYSAGGSAQPFATLANPFSSANYTFAPITVSRGLGVTVGPDPGLQYAGVPILFTVGVNGGSGTAPYGPACFSDGIGATVCNATAAPPWKFSITYPQTGRYQARIYVADSGGTNYTMSLPVTISSRPGLGTINLSQSEVDVGGVVTATAEVRGGALPISYWWNTTAPTRTVGGGGLSSDGPVGVSFHASTVPVNSLLNLTIVDALGTRFSASVRVFVVSTNATRILLNEPPNATAAAGTPIRLSFEAVDALQEAVPGYNGSFSILPRLADYTGVWVNASGSTSVQEAGGIFGVLGSAWTYGFLNLTFTDRAVGIFNLSFNAAGSVQGPSPMRIQVGPYVADEHLSRIDVARPGDRENSTLYEIRDRFGNPVTDGWVLVRSVFGATVTDLHSTIRPSGTGSVVWVNYSAGGSGAGTVYVLSESNQSLLSPIAVPALADAPLGQFAYAAVLGLGMAAVVGAAVIARRRRAASAENQDPDSDSAVEDGLKRLAEGRAHVLERVPLERAVDLDHIAGGWTGPPPDAAELAEWVGSLVSEGILKPSIGPEGRPMFVRLPAAAPAPPLRVEVDAMALDAALERQRLESTRSDEGPTGSDEPSDGYDPGSRPTRS
ncbi:MAG: hypothetical protein L3J95_04210 [Thermoplasmata archaeon]|nr:hypothetical protein [Thermoplasmata archaeon]MCI4359610.1 hypothetical protein [Thermoplasmata archaeon]